MKILFEHTESAPHHLNEDRIGFNNNVIWVMDGLTEKFFNNTISKENDVVWFVEEMNNELTCADSLLTLHEMLKVAVDNVYKKACLINPDIINYEPYQLPSATIAMLKEDKGTLEYLILGDCSIITEDEEILTDYRLRPFHERIMAEKNKYSGQDNYKKRIDEFVKRIRRTINTEEGYWVLGLDSKVINHALKGTIHVQDKNCFRVICCSDGFYPSIIENGNTAISIKEFFREDNLPKIIHNQRELEITREKRENRIFRDDLSVILIQI